MSQLFIGLMSGTSMDAVDAAVVDFGIHPPLVVSTYNQSIPSRLRQRLLALADPGWRGPLEEVGELDSQVGALFGEAVLRLLEGAGIEPGAVAAIGSHGQTVRHRPTGTSPFSMQIGDPNRIAEMTGITTIADFRRRDIAAGGQGAPLVPAFHRAVLSSTQEDRAVVNIGGIANLTFLPSEPEQDVFGFDTGPGNVLMDCWSERCWGESYDRDGQQAAAGTVVPHLLEQMLADRYFGSSPPKSTGREHFNGGWLERQLVSLSSEPSQRDVQTTLTELTARSIGQAVLQYAPSASRVLVCGGGARNKHLMKRLSQLLAESHIEVGPTADHGIDPDWMEATAFAWLAKQTLEGRPGAMPSVTGATHPVILGGIYPGAIK